MHFVQTLALTVGLAASALSATTNTGNMVNTGNEVDMANIVASETLRPLNCMAYYVVRPGDTCMRIMDDHPNTMSLQQLLTWNPLIQRDCRNLLPNQTVCIRAKMMADCPSVSSSTTAPQFSTTMTNY